MTPASRADAIPLAVAVERLGSVHPLEDWSPVHGCALWIVDLAGDPGELDDATAAAVLERISEVPCPVIGKLRGTAPSAFAREFARRCDALAESAAECDALRSGAEQNPLAALALVHLLRHGDGRTTSAGLVAESAVYSMLQAGPEFARWLKRAAAERRPLPEPDGPPVFVRRTGPLLEIELDRPDRHNAFSAGIRDALVEAFELATRAPDLERVVLRGRGASFCSGGDLDEFGTLPDPATAHAIRATRSPARLAAQLSNRLWAQVHGACIGAGIELPAFAARVTAREGAYFQLPELSLGLVPGAGGTVSLPRRIGRQRVARLALTGERLDAESAFAWRLVDDLVATDEPFPS